MATEADTEGLFVSPTAAAPVLVGFDGEEGGRDALELGRVLGAVRETRCVVAIPKLDGLAAEARATLGDPDATVLIVGSLAPAKTLVELAEKVHAGTLVVGSTRADRLEQTVIRTVAEHLLNHAPCEVAVAPRDYREGRQGALAKVAVAVDGTRESKLALTRAEDLAREAGAELQVLVAEDPVVEGIEARAPADAPPAFADVLEAALRAVDPALSPTGKRVKVEWPAVPARTASALIEACDEDVDLLVSGSRRQLERVLSGSVTKHLVNAAPFPVLVIPHSRHA